MNSSALIFLLMFVTAYGFQAHKPKEIRVARTQHVKFNPYINGGVIVKGREFPGMVSVQVSGNPFCGGSILNENYILTAAFCAQSYGIHLYDILSGTNLLNEGGTKHNVTEVHIHEKYDGQGSYHNDIAVLKVHPPFVFDDNTAPIKLPQPGQETPAGSMATLIGWGDVNRDYPTDLRKIELPVSDLKECENFYKKIGLTIYPEQICADTPELYKGPCYKDEGGPLSVKGEVIGILSWYEGCGVKGYPSVYTQVSDYIEWINSKINSYGGELPSDLRKVDILISDHNKCKQFYVAEGTSIYPEQICTDTPEGNKGSCNGDGGGPPFVNGKVIGLVSWGRGCADKGYPTVYTEVADYIDWIHSKINS